MARGNIDRAIADFRGYIVELETCGDIERRDQIRREAVWCQDLMNYSPEMCDFTELDKLVHRVFQMVSPTHQRPAWR